MSATNIAAEVLGVCIILALIMATGVTIAALAKMIYDILRGR